MKYVLTGEQAKEADLFTINERKIPAKELMKKAGFKMYEVLKRYINKQDSILIVCGAGNNGGDGYVLGSFLYENGFDVSIFQYKTPKTSEAIAAYSEFNGKIIKEINKNYDVVVDAIFGVGLSRDLDDITKNFISFLNKMSGFKVSLDIPSGLDSTNGNIMGNAFVCDLLITVQCLKSGLFLNKGVTTFEKVEIVDIGIDTSCVIDKLIIYEDEDFQDILQKRSKICNKGTFGKVALVGGSHDLCGAAILSASALASLRCGVGYSRICVPEKLYDIYALRNPENIYFAFKSDDKGNILFDEENLRSILNYDCIGVGMGLGCSENVYNICRYLLENYTGNLVLDADALNSISAYNSDILSHHKCNLVITPHIKEFSRLTKLSVDEILKKELSFARFFAKKRDLTLVLKSNTTIICNSQNCVLNITGNPSLAKGGSGDILTGIIVGLLSFTSNKFLSSCFGPYLLGKCAESICYKIDERSVIATDIANEIGYVLKNIKDK